MKLSEFKPCTSCGLPVDQPNGLLFYRVRIERMAFDHAAIRGIAGVALVVGSLPLAQALAPDSEIAKPLAEQTMLLLCDACACSSTCIAALDELASDASAGGETVATSPARVLPGVSACG